MITRLAGSVTDSQKMAIPVIYLVEGVSPNLSFIHQNRKHEQSTPDGTWWATDFDHEPSEEGNSSGEFVSSESDLLVKAYLDVNH